MRRAFPSTAFPVLGALGCSLVPGAGGARSRFPHRLQEARDE